MKQFILTFLTITFVFLLTNCSSQNEVAQSAKPSRELSKDTNTLNYPDTTDWIVHEFEDITFKAPKKWKINYHKPNGYGLLIFPDYPEESYFIKSERFIPYTMEAFFYDGTKEAFCELFEYHCGFDLAENRKWIENSMKDITWHIDTENITYVEGIEAGERNHSCVGYKKINGKAYWFDFDGLFYLIDNTLLRLTQEDCLTAVLVFNSMRQL